MSGDHLPLEQSSQWQKMLDLGRQFDVFQSQLDTLLETVLEGDDSRVELIQSLRSLLTSLDNVHSALLVQRAEWREVLTFALQIRDQRDEALYERDQLRTVLVSLWKAGVLDDRLATLPQPDREYIASLILNALQGVSSGKDPS
jgi:hypothetical protein